MDVAKQSEWLVPERVDQAYRHLTGYRFAQRYVEGKAVVDITWRNLGYGTRLLAKTAESVVGLTDSVSDLQRARTFHSAPNVHYGMADFSELPYPDAHFEVMLAFEVIENLRRPESLVEEARRILKQEGTFIITTPDKRFSNERNRKDASRHEMYVPELRDLLDRNFGQVEILRCGSVAGGLVYKEPEASSDTTVESAPLTLTDPSFDDAWPQVDLVMAVCRNSAPQEQEGERAYLLLDADRRLLEENEDDLEDIELLRDEIRLMEETEVRAFRDTLEVRQANVANLKAQQKHLKTRVRNKETRIKNLETQIKNKETRIKNLKTQVRNKEAHINNIEQSNAWRRLLKVYQRLRGV